MTKPVAIIIVALLVCASAWGQSVTPTSPTIIEILPLIVAGGMLLVVVVGMLFYWAARGDLNEIN